MKIKLALMVVISAILLGGCSISFSAGEDDEKKMDIVKEEIIDEDINHISIDWNVGDIKLLESNSKNIKVVEKGTDNFSKDEMFTFSVSDGKLDIIDKYKGDNKISINVGYNLEVYLPTKEFEKIDIKGISCDVTAEDLKTKKLVASGKSSDYNISGFINDFSFESSSGDVKLNCFTMPSKIEIDGKSTDVTLALPENDGFTLKYDMSSDDIECDFSTIMQTEGKKIYGNGLCDIYVSLASGDIKIMCNK